MFDARYFIWKPKIEEIEIGKQYTYLGILDGSVNLPEFAVAAAAVPDFAAAVEVGWLTACSTIGCFGPSPAVESDLAAAQIVGQIGCSGSG